MSSSRPGLRAIAWVPAVIVSGVALLASACGGSTGSTTASRATQALGGSPACPSGSSSAARSEVAVVVQASASSVSSRCVAVASSGSIGAVAALAAAKVDIGTQSYSFGLAICQVDGVPAHYSQCLPSGQPYWALFVSRRGGGWVSASTGVSGITLKASDSLGLRYDPAKGSPAPPSIDPPL